MERRSYGDAPIEQLPLALQQLLTFEREYLHDPQQFQDPSRDPSFDACYFPQNCRGFQLPCFWVMRKHMHVYGAHAGGDSIFAESESQESGGRVLLPIHPTALHYYEAWLSSVSARDSVQEGLRIWAVPTSSTRTLLAWPDGAPHRASFVKTTLHSPIFGDRHLRLQKVARSVGLSRLVQESSAQLPASLGYFWEPVGYVPRALQDSGAIVRPVPTEMIENLVFAAPLFSLFGGQTKRSLLLDLLEHADMSALQFLQEVLCEPFARLWVEMSLGFGLMIEAHGQDLLMQLSPDLKPIPRFYYRDFEGLQVDWQLRAARGLSTPIRMPRECCWFDVYDTWGFQYSQMAWYKLHISLFNFVDLVLKELEVAIGRWQGAGHLGGPRIKEGSVVELFSELLAAALKQMLGSKVPNALEDFE